MVMRATLTGLPPGVLDAVLDPDDPPMGLDDIKVAQDLVSVAGEAMYVLDFLAQLAEAELHISQTRDVCDHCRTHTKVFAFGEGGKLCRRCLFRGEGP